MEEQEFRRLTDPHRRELLAHCYRILGSAADADDALQDALLRAWKGLPSFEGRSSLRRWLYSIATRTSLDIAERRRARLLPSLELAPGEPTLPLPAPGEGPWVEPIADEAIDDAPNPEARVSTRESVALAFIALLQRLPPRQRAVLVLRDVAGYSAEETAEILEISVAAANSALQRARELTVDPSPSDATPDPELLARFVRACETRDADALVALVTRDVAVAMPPLPLWLRGADAYVAFARDVMFTLPAMRDQRLVATRANGCPAFGVYARDAGGVYRPTALNVLVVRGGLIAEQHAFLAADFARFGLPATLP